MILLPEALKVRGDKIANELSGSVVLGCGQFCTNPGLIIGLNHRNLANSLSISRLQWLSNRHKVCLTKVL